MKRNIKNIIELVCIGIAISQGMVLATAILYTKLIGCSNIVFWFNSYGEHLFEAIVFPLITAMAFVFWCIRANNLGKVIKQG